MAKGFVILGVVSGVLLVGSGYGEWISGGRGWNYSNADTNFYPWSTACRIGIGTTDPGTARLAVMGGNVGIGTTSPSSALHVVGASISNPASVRVTKAWAGGSQDVAILGTGSSSYIADNEYAILQMYQAGTERIRLYAGGDSWINPTTGNLGIGTTSPGAKLDVAGSGKFAGDVSLTTNDLSWTSVQKDFSAAPRSDVSPMSIRMWDNYNGGGPTTYGTVLDIYGRGGHEHSQLYFGHDGSIMYRDAFYNETTWPAWRTVTMTTPSDVRLKENIKPIDGALAKTLALRGVSFEWKDNAFGDSADPDVQGSQIGLIAQEVEEVLPEVILHNKVVMEGMDDIKSIDYSRLTALLVEAIKEQQKEIEVQQKEIEELKARIRD